jgi:carbon-monoxide dehydrogenase small subunit
LNQLTIRFTINGEPKVIVVPTNRLLIDLLRDDLGLTGTKEGCGIGVCGSCSVLLDGRLFSSCLVLAASIDGSNLVTIEGLRGDAVEALREAFIDCGGFQCGICTPGQIVAATALLEETPDADDRQIREWMMGNLCRCTGYHQIVEAIARASAGSSR